MKSKCRTPQISLAIGAADVTVLTGQSERPHVVARSVDDSGTRAPLTHAFADIRAWLRTAGGIEADRAVVDVAIMPSLCEVRLVNLPLLRPAEAESVIRRDAGKHFTVTADQRVIGVRVPKRTRRSSGGGVGTGVPVMAASVSHGLLEEIIHAAAAHGWTVRRMVPAHAAWLHAVSQPAARGEAPRARAFIATESEYAYLARVEDGSPVQLRRMHASQHDAIAAALGAGPGTVTLFANEGMRGGVTNALSVAGWSVLPAPMGGAAAAAKHAAGAPIELVSESRHATRGVQQRSLANRLAAAAVVLAIASVLGARWGAHRELDSVRARRAAIRAQVAPLVALRDSVERLEARTRETNELFESGARWSKTLYEISMLLPEDAHLMRLNATGDTIMIEAEGASAGAALQAITRAPTLRNVRIDGPVQRELEAGATAKERFVIEATHAGGRLP